MGFDGLVADKLAIRIDRSRVAVDLWDILAEAQAGRAHPLLLSAERPLERLLENLETLDPAFRIWLLAKRQTLTDRARLQLETAMREEGKRTAVREVLARALMNLDPTHEEAARVRIRARAEAGDIGAALGIYKALWDLLDEEYERRAVEGDAGADRGDQAGAARGRRVAARRGSGCDLGRRHGSRAARSAGAAKALVQADGVCRRLRGLGGDA